MLTHTHAHCNQSSREQTGSRTERVADLQAYQGCKTGSRTGLPSQAGGPNSPQRPSLTFVVQLTKKKKRAPIDYETEKVTGGDVTNTPDETEVASKCQTD